MFKKNILPSDLFVLKIKSATFQQGGYFHHRQIIQAWVVYSLIGKLFTINTLTNVKQLDISFKIFADKD